MSGEELKEKDMRGHPLDFASSILDLSHLYPDMRSDAWRESNQEM